MQRVVASLENLENFFNRTQHTIWPIQQRDMATTTQLRVRGRPAHTPGPTYCSYTPDGTKLVTVGSNNTARVYHTGSDGEPANVDEIMENNLAVGSTVCL